MNYPITKPFLNMFLVPHPKSAEISGSCHIFRLRCGSYQVLVQRSYWGWCSFSRKVHCIKNSLPSLSSWHLTYDRYINEYSWSMMIYVLKDQNYIYPSNQDQTKEPSLCCTPEAWNFGWAAGQEFDLNGRWLAGRLTMCKFSSFYSYLYLI